MYFVELTISNIQESLDCGGFCCATNAPTADWCNSDFDFIVDVDVDVDVNVDVDVDVDVDVEVDADVIFDTECHTGVVVDDVEDLVHQLHPRLTDAIQTSCSLDHRWNWRRKMRTRLVLRLVPTKDSVKEEVKKW